MTSLKTEEQKREPWAMQLAREAVTERHNTLASFDVLAYFRDEFSIADDADQETATAQLREYKELWAGLEAERKKITTPLNAALKATNDFFRPALEGLREGERILKAKIAQYLEAREAANREAIVAASLAQTPEQAAEQLAKVELVETPKGVHVRQVWKFEVEDPELVPREFCSPDPKKIESVDPTTTKIPGVRFFQEEIVTARVR